MEISDGGVQFQIIRVFEHARYSELQVHRTPFLPTVRQVMVLVRYGAETASVQSGPESE